MNLEKLRYVVEVAKSNSIKIASENLHVTQSAISQAISNVEKELGVKIFSRSRGQYSLLTEEGKGIVQKSYEVLRKFEELKELGRSQNVQMKGEIILATLPGYMYYLIDPLSKFKDLYPNVNVKVIEKRNAEIISGIQQQRFDVGLIACYGDILETKDDIGFNLLFDGRAKVVTSKDNLMAYTGKVLLEDLQKHSLIAFQGDYTPMFIQKYSQKFKPLNVLFESNNTEVVLNAVSSGLGFTISFDFLLQKNKSPYMKNGQIVALDIFENDQTIPLKVSFGWIRSKKKHVSSSTKKLLELIQSSL